MNNSTIKTIFNNFRVGGVVIPVEFKTYKGNSTSYVTFESLGTQPKLSCDNLCEYSVIQYDFDIYTKGNYTNILQAVKNKLKENGFAWVEDSEDMYEEDTMFYHKVTTFEIENFEN